MRRQTRLMAILEHLRGRRTGTTANALAERFGVTLRTIYRDLDTLREASIPLRAERGRGDAQPFSIGEHLSRLAPFVIL